MTTLHVVLAPNAFKGTLTAHGAAEAMAAGVRDVDPNAACVRLPLPDGGDGTVDAFVTHGYGQFTIRARDALGNWHPASLALRDGHAVVEIANTCGLAMLDTKTRSPLTASTRGLGDAILAALDHGAKHITVGLGGSASTDGGSGVLVALGARLLDPAGAVLEPGGSTLGQVHAIDLSGLDPRLAAVTIDVLSDVTSPLDGPAGAAHVFAAQKGASPAEIHALDDGLRHWGRILAAATGVDVGELPGSGAAGGTGAALAAALGAPLLSGAGQIADLFGYRDAIRDADLVITGEGRLDASTLAGKGCATAIRLARESDTPAIAVCGDITLDPSDMQALGLSAWHTAGPPGDDPAGVLATAAKMALETWLGP